MKLLVLLVVAIGGSAMASPCAPPDDTPPDHSRPGHTPSQSNSSPTSTPTAMPTREAFTALSHRPDSLIQLIELNASAGHFWLFKDTSTYCEPQVEHCPPGDLTVLTANGTALDVEVPGGQRIYVAPSGALSYTRPHSAYIPPGSSTTGFEYVPGPNYGNYYYKDGFMACPVPADRVRFQIFAGIKDADVPMGNVSECQGFDFVTTRYPRDGPAAWEYA